MADSTADATAENADTLKQKLTKLLTEILDDGGGSKDRSETGDGSFDVLKSIDEAIRVLTCMRKVESKQPESDIPSSSKVAVPKEFKCPLSNEIMIEPVIISSGQTYEKKYIKTAIPHVVLTPNHLVDDLITQWCRVNGYDRRCEERVTELSTNGIDSLLHRILSPSSVSDQTEAADELRRQTKKFANVRDLFVHQIPYSITRMLSPLSALGEVADLNPELHKNLVATLFNISIVEKHKTVIAINPLVIPVLAKSLNTVHTRRVSASTLWSLSIVDSNKLIIGNSEALMALIGAIEGGDVLATTAAASTVYNLCIVSENRERAVSAGLIPVLTNKIKSGKNVVDELFAVLALISTHKRAIEEMEDLGFINDLLSILRRTSDAVIAENAIVIVFNMCDRIRDLPRVNVLRGEENQYGTFSKLAASQGSDLTVRKAETILQWFKRYG